MNFYSNSLAEIVDAVSSLSTVEPTTLRALADRFGHYPRHLESAFQALARRSILAGSRGRRGGYRLLRPLDQITVADIAVAADLTHTAKANSDTAADIAGAISAGLSSITLATIAGRHSPGEAK